MIGYTLYEVSGRLQMLMIMTKGRVTLQKWMNFRKSFKLPLTPPHFWKIILRISRQKCVCSLWLDCYNISHEMHVVQQFNMVIG